MSTTRIAIVGHRYHGFDTGKSIEWIAPDKRAAIRLVRRIRQRNIDGVVLIHADLTHGISAPIVSACKLTGVGVTACEKRSQTQIKSALDVHVASKERQSP